MKRISNITQLATLLVIWVTVAINSHASIILVPQQQPTIAAGIAAANPGDTVYVSAGTYYEFNLQVTNSITISSITGPTNTIIDNQYNGRGFVVSSPTSGHVLLNGLTIQNSQIPYYNSGGAVLVVTGQCTISSCIIQGTSGDAGYSSGPIANDGNVNDVNVNNCIVRNNFAANGAGIRQCAVYNCWIYGNTGGNCCAALFSACNATNCTVYGNGGGYLSNPWTVGGGFNGNYDNCIFWDNLPSYNNQEIYQPSGVSYCIVEGGFSGTGNLSSDPLFVNAAAGNFNLQSNSPAIGAGDPAVLMPNASPSNIGASGNVNSGFPINLSTSFLTNGLVAYYPFNGNPNDATADGLNAVINGGVTLVSDRFGRLDSAYQFDGTTGFMNVNDPAGILNFDARSNNYSVTLWFELNATNVGGQKFIADRYNNSPCSYDIYYNGSLNAFKLDIWDGSYSPPENGGVSLTSLHGTGPGVWHQIAIVVNNRLCQLYLDGIEDTGGGSMLAATTASTKNTDGIRQIGSDGIFSTTRLDGIESDIRIYNRALSSNEVAQLYAYESTPPQPAFVTNGLVAYYPFNGNANDASGNGNNGTAFNTQSASDRFGNPNSAFAFNGINGSTNTSMVIVSNQLINLGQPAYTINMWFMPSNITQVTSTLFANANTSVGLTMDFNNNNEPDTLAFFVGPGNAFWDSLNNHSPVMNFQAGQWHSASLIKSNLLYSLYIDGQLEDQVTVPAAAAYNFKIEPLIGAYYLDGSEAFAGNINDVRIYNRAMSANEVAQLYAFESTPPTSMPPAIVSQPQSVTVNANANASFSVTATATSPLSYQWSFNGTNITGANASNLTISNVTPSALGSYAVVVSDASGSITSSNAILTMYPYLSQPFNGDVVDWGQSANLSVQAWGTGPLMYQWYDNGVAIANATNQTFHLPSIGFASAGLYSVVVSSPYGSVTNTPAQLVVNVAGVSLGFSPTLTIVGVPGFTYVIQSTTNLENTNSWITLTNMTLAEPVQLFIDTTVDASSPFNPQHFYKVLPGE